jgi:hypothetical protein
MVNLRRAVLTSTTAPITGIVVAVLLWSTPSPAQKNPLASQHFDKGVSLFNNEDYEGALVEFKAAYSAEPHYAVRYNIGVCLYKLHRYSEAQVEMSAFLEEGGKSVSGKKRTEIEGMLEELKSFVGFLDVDCNVAGAQLHIDDRSVATLPLEYSVALEVGEYRITVTADGYEDHTTKITVPGGDVVVLEVELSTEEKRADESSPQETGEVHGTDRKRLSPAIFWSLTALAAASAAGAAVTGGLGLKYKNEYDAMDATEDWKPLQKKVRTLALTTNILWGVTGAFALSAFITAFFTRFRSEGKQDVGTVSITMGSDRMSLSCTWKF